MVRCSILSLPAEQHARNGNSSLVSLNLSADRQHQERLDSLSIFWKRLANGISAFSLLVGYLDCRGPVNSNFCTLGFRISILISETFHPCKLKYCNRLWLGVAIRRSQLPHIRETRVSGFRVCLLLLAHRVVGSNPAFVD